MKKSKFYLRGKKTKILQIRDSNFVERSILHILVFLATVLGMRHQRVDATGKSTEVDDAASHLAAGRGGSRRLAVASNR